MTAIGNITSLQAGGGSSYIQDKRDGGSGGASNSSGINSAAYNDQVDLSDFAKRAVEAHAANDAFSKTTANAAAAGAAQATTDPEFVRSEKVADAKRQVQGLVGLDGVSAVVDGFGNIDTAKLQEIEAQQA